ncbi:hypothetical protein O3G_MSEX000377 [Manduca sexta]|nr:hypothetical protein O3G_MSEX000377 [Manduca sexta]
MPSFPGAVSLTFVKIPLSSGRVKRNTLSAASFNNVHKASAHSHGSFIETFGREDILFSTIDLKLPQSPSFNLYLILGPC